MKVQSTHRHDVTTLFGVERLDLDVKGGVGGPVDSPVARHVGRVATRMTGRRQASTCRLRYSIFTAN